MLAIAFDSVWHQGLFVKMYELGIKGKLWRVLVEAYKDMETCVLVNGSYSKWIPVKRSVRQGSIFGAWLFLIMFNDLAIIFRKSGLGASIGTLIFGVLFQADDIAR